MIAAPASRPTYGPVTEPTHRKKLADEITELAGHIHAATARWLLMIAEFDRDKVWADWDCQSCAHWLMWRCGLSPVAAREHVRVANRLADLPQITAVFLKGGLSYSQVRALSRVASADTEEELLAMAQQATAAQIETMVSAYRRVKNLEVAEQELNAERVRHARRYFRHRIDDDGSFVFSGRLTPEEGALVLRALETAGRAVTGSDDSAESQERELETKVADEAAEAAAKEWEEGVDRDLAAAFLRDSAESCPTSRRNADALVVMAETLLEAGPQARSGGDRNQLIVHVDIESLATDKGTICHLEDGVAIAPEVARRLGCDASVVTLIERDGEPLDVGRKSRTPTAAMRRALAARDRGCRFPGCTQKHFVDAHHIEHWVRDGGPTKLRNLVQLCRFHHRLVHEYGYEVSLERGRATFIRPDGSRISSDPPAPVPADTNVVDLNGRRGLKIDPGTCVTGWSGDPMNLEDAVGALLSWNPSGAQT